MLLFIYTQILYSLCKYFLFLSNPPLIHCPIKSQSIQNCYAVISQGHVIRFPWIIMCLSDINTKLIKTLVITLFDIYVGPFFSLYARRSSIRCSTDFFATCSFTVHSNPKASKLAMRSSLMSVVIFSGLIRAYLTL